MLLAPNLIFVTQMTGSQLPSDAMKDGVVQLAIAGFFEGRLAGFIKQTIFSDRFLTLTRTGNPSVNGRLSIESYLKLGHVIISPNGDLTTTVDKALRKKRLKRRIVASVANFSVSGPIVANSNLVLTAPGRRIEKFS